MRLLEGYSILYTSHCVRVSRIRAKLVCLSVTSKQAKVAPECCHGVQGWKWRCPLTTGDVPKQGVAVVKWTLLWNMMACFMLCAIARARVSFIWEEPVGKSTQHYDCHDLAKWLSHYLYFFSFSFSFGLTTHKKCRKV